MKFGQESYKQHGNVRVTSQPGTNNRTPVVIGVDESVLPIGDSLKEDLIVSDVAWDETVEEPVFIPTSGDESNISEYFARKFSDSSYFLYLSYEHPPTTEFFLCTPLHHRSQMGLFDGQNRPP